VENVPKYIVGVTSRVWSISYHNYYAILKELKTKVVANKTLYQYLIGYKFTLLTDHLPLKKILETATLQDNKLYA
jgi:hypothetical protein